MGDNHPIYPTDGELERIRTWGCELQFKDLFDFIESIWWCADWGFRRNKWYHLSTGGWSGNEDIIGAMEANKLFWKQCFISVRKGGHYKFKAMGRIRVPKKAGGSHVE